MSEAQRLSEILGRLNAISGAKVTLPVEDVRWLARQLAEANTHLSLSAETSGHLYKRAREAERQLAEAKRERDYWKRQAQHVLKASMAMGRLRKLLREMAR